MRGIQCVLSALALLAAFGPSSALYFYVSEGTQRCFIEEVPADTLVVGKYENPDFQPFGTPGFTDTGVQVIVTDPMGTSLLKKNLDRAGRFAFTATQGGEHVLCLSTNNTKWFGVPKEFKFELALQVGEEAIDYNEVAKREHLDTLELAVRQLNDKARDILREQNYQREREIAFRNTSESTNARVMWWSLVSIVLVVGSGLYQVAHLRSFFRKKKLV